MMFSDYRILHKLLQQPLDSKDKATYDRLLINTLQSLSGILHRKESQEERLELNNGDLLYLPLYSSFLQLFVYQHLLISFIVVLLRACKICLWNRKFIARY